MIHRIDPSYTAFFVVSSRPDTEWQRIIELLSSKYGVKSSGSKSADKAKLHELELREAQRENTVTSKFLTVTKGEQEKIQEKKKTKRKDINLEKKSENQQGAKILGEQIYIAIKMNKEKNNNNKRKK